MNMYRVGIIGLGNIAWLLDEDPLRKEIWTHLGAYNRNEQTVVVAACDTDAERVAAFAEKQPGVRCYGTPAEMLDSEELDIASICTPPAAHYANLAECARHDMKAIFCEKPLAENSRLAGEMAALCRKKKILLAVNHIKRWDDCYLLAREVLESGRLGALRTIVGYVDTALYTNAIHMVDLFRYFGSEVEWLIGRLQQDYVRIVDGKADSGGEVLFGFKNGAWGFLKASGKDWSYHSFEIDLQCDEGRIRVYNADRDVEIWKFEGSRFLSGYKEMVQQPVVYPFQRKDRMLRAVENIVASLDGKQSLTCSGRDGVAVLQLVEAIHASDERGCEKIYL